MSKGVGLVLAGGGGKGAYHIGVWKALNEYGIDKNICAVAGTSVGALNAVLFSTENYKLGEYVWRNISTDEILKVDIKKIVQKLMTFGIVKGELEFLAILLKNYYGNGIFSREGLTKIIDENINLREVSNSEIEIFASAYNINTLEIEYLKINNQTPEKIKEILLATSALPIIFDTQKVDNNYYIDGGIKDNVPIKPLYDKGIRNFIVVHLSRDSIVNKKEFNDANIIEVLPSKDQGDLISGTLDFSKEGVDRRISQGYQDTIKILRPIYEMGQVEAKIGNELRSIKKEEGQFKLKKSIILNQRKVLKDELKNLLNEY